MKQYLGWLQHACYRQMASWFLPSGNDQWNNKAIEVVDE